MERLAGHSHLQLLGWQHILAGSQVQIRTPGLWPEILRFCVPLRSGPRPVPVRPRLDFRCSCVPSRGCWAQRSRVPSVPVRCPRTLARLTAAVYFTGLFCGDTSTVKRGCANTLQPFSFQTINLSYDAGYSSPKLTFSNLTTNNLRIF